jgi:hypothetical protein
MRRTSSGKLRWILPPTWRQRTQTPRGALTLGGVLGGANHQLTRDVYTLGSSVTIEGGITFKGTDTDIFIIQIALDMLQVVGKIMTLEGGALTKSMTLLGRTS